MTHREGKRVVFAASGAIGVGATRLNEQATLARSVRSHIHGGHVQETSARARAAAGQGGLRVCTTRCLMCTASPVVSCS